MKKVILLKYDCLKRHPRFFKCTFLMLFVLGTIAAQAQTVSGKVTDELQSSLPGVNILLKGTTTGTTTDANGNYTINIPEGTDDAVLVFSFIGYTTEEQAVGGRTRVDISMLPSIESLAEIVVVGYGVQKKSDVTGSLVSVGSKELKEVPVANLQQALQGRAAGVEVQRMGTAPGATARIRVRGDRSILGSNDPLIVLDGIPYDGSLSDINQDEIATINVLKDASATAIYGSRGANGVILITTKRGEVGETRVTIDSYYGINTVQRKYDLYNAEEYAAMRDASPWAGGYLPAEIEGMAIGRDVDWQELMYQDGYITNHNLGVRGGTESSQYAIGAGYFKETTVLPGQDFTRYSIKAAIDSKIKDRIKIGLTSLNSVSTANGTQFVNPQGIQGGYGGGSMFNILAPSPLVDPYLPNGEINPTPFGNADDNSANYSPLYLKQNNNNWEDLVRRLRTFNSMYAEIEIIDGLKYRFNLGLDYGQQNFAQFQGQDSYFRVDQGNRARVRNTEEWSWTAENIITYDKTFAEKHRLSFTGLYSAQERKTWFTQVGKDSINADFIQYYDLGQSTQTSTSTAVLSGNEQTWGLLSYMARLNYAFDDRYLLTVTFRRDGSSKLAQKWHQYPAFGAGWNVMNESFMQDLSVISNLKVRVGYGQTSNQSVDPYTTLGGVVNTTGNSAGNQPIYYNFGTSSVVGGYIPGRIPDQTLDWEYTNTLNVGLDFGILGDRVTGTFDWYDAKTNNLLFNKQLPTSSGYELAFQTNVGEMENKGMEIAISSINIESPSGFKWSTDFNWFYNRNKIVDLGPDVERNIANGIFVGYPLNAIYDYNKQGIWQLDEADQAAVFGQKPGDLKLEDVNGDNALDADNDRKIIGDQQATWQAGMTNRFEYKGFDLSVVAFMRYGGTLLSYLHAPYGAYLANNTGQRNGLDVDYWTPENPTNAYPSPSSEPLASVSTAWTTLGYYDASFLKVRSISLGYRLPENLLSKIGAHSARVYFTAQNPFILWSPYVTDHGGVDPEPTGQGSTGSVSVAQGVRTTGANQTLIISASTPPTRAFIVGLNLSF